MAQAKTIVSIARFIMSSRRPRFEAGILGRMPSGGIVAQSRGYRSGRGQPAVAALDSATRPRGPAMPSSDLHAAHVVSRGALRLSLFPSFFWRIESSGAPRGVGVTIAQALADRIGVTLDCAVHGSPPEVVEA